MPLKSRDSLPLSFSDTVIAYFTCSGEEFSVLVETDSHDSICRVEGLFNTITVVDVDIDINYSLVISADQPMIR
jgi:hypothetical protein